MTREARQLGLIRLLVALVFATVAATIVYTIVSYGQRLFFPYFVIVLALGACLAVFVFVPLMVALLKLDRVSLLWIVGVTFVAFGVIFAIFNVLSMGEAVTVIERGRTLVSEGRITTLGYMIALRDSCITALIASFGALIFWMIAFRRS